MDLHDTARDCRYSQADGGAQDVSISACVRGSERSSRTTNERARCNVNSVSALQENETFYVAENVELCTPSGTMPVVVQESSGGYGREVIDVFAQLEDD